MEGGDFLLYEKLVIRNRKGTYVLALEEILYMEKNLRKICVYTQTNQVEFYGRFPDILDCLDDRFLYCHRSYVINMDRVVVMTNKRIFVTNNACIFFGRDTYCRAKKIFDAYLDKKIGRK